MRCPHCQEESFGKKKKLTRGWKIIGEITVCALCGTEWKSSASADDAPEQGASTDKLKALLGGDFREKTELAGSADSRFCRNCKYFIVHPFKTVCALSDETADPMGECASFAER